MYKMFRGEMYSEIKLHRETLQNYLAFSTAVLSATIGGYFQLGPASWAGTAILSAGSVMNLIVCTIGIRMCDRFYLGLLERIAIVAKLESVLGLTDNRPKRSKQSEVMALAGDKYLLPQWWVLDPELTTTEEFIKRHRNSGINRLAKSTFRILIVVPIIFAIANIAMLIL